MFWRYGSGRLQVELLVGLQTHEDFIAAVLRPTPARNITFWKPTQHKYKHIEKLYVIRIAWYLDCQSAVTETDRYHLECSRDREGPPTSTSRHPLQINGMKKQITSKGASRKHVRIVNCSETEDSNVTRWIVKNTGGECWNTGQCIIRVHKHWRDNCNAVSILFALCGREVQNTTKKSCKTFNFSILPQIETKNQRNNFRRYSQEPTEHSHEYIV